MTLTQTMISTPQYVKKTIKIQPIAPAPPHTSILSMSSSNILSDSSSGYKKKYIYSSMPFGDQPPSVVRRNARERNRVKKVNNGFANLREHIPQTIINALTNGGRGASKKLSKVDTLRLAVEYIRRLQDVIENVDSECDTSRSSISSTSTSTYCTLQSASSPSSSTSSYYTESEEHQNYQIQSYQSSSSPAPSYSSDISVGSQQPYTLNGSGDNFKYEPYEYSVQTPVEDEELLDYISSWQEQ